MYFFVICILYYQFVDSFGSNIFDGFQSFALRDFLIIGHGMTENEAVSYMGLAMFPFYIITALAPAARMMVDKFGIRRVMFANLFLLLLGCVLCVMSDNIIVYLLGTAIIILTCSTDIQNIYLVTSFPNQKRASIKGFMGGVSAISMFMIPVIRKLIVNDFSVNWKVMYLIAILFSVIAILIYALTRNDKTKNNFIKDKKVCKRSSTDNAYIDSHKRKYIKMASILLVIVGVATPAVTFYNEPMLSFSGMKEKDVTLALMVQAVVLFGVKLVCGVLADRFGKIRMAVIYLIFTCLSLVGYVITIICMPIFAPACAGACFGIMVGCYFSGKDLIELVILENADSGKLGCVSAFSTYAYGIGDGIGIVLMTLLVGYAGMGSTKLIVGIPVFVISILYSLYIFNDSFFVPES